MELFFQTSMFCEVKIELELLQSIPWKLTQVMDVKEAEQGDHFNPIN